jgi:hypothetical protein
LRYTGHPVEIEYFPVNEEERVETAVNGFHRVMKDYTRVKTFARAVEKIRLGMRAEGYRIKRELRVEPLVARV